MNAERTRWRIADLLNRLPGQCWADLATWALYGPEPGRRWPWAPNTPGCREDAARTGCCYCGKLTDPEGEKRWDEHVAQLEARWADEDGPA